MSYSFTAIGKDKGKLKEAVRNAQVKDETNSPHSGIPKWVADHLCDEIDRVRIYSWEDKANGTTKQFALSIVANGSFHEQGNNHTMVIQNVQLVE